jgi:hypothetical protein
MDARSVIRLVFIVLALAVLAVGVVYRGVLDPWNKGWHGPGWECDMTRGGATICTKDVPPDLQQPRKPH